MLTAKERKLMADLRAAEARGEDPAGVLYEAMDLDAKRAFWRRRAK